MYQSIPFTSAKHPHFLTERDVCRHQEGACAYSFIEQWNHGAKLLKQAWAAGQVVHRSSAVSGIFGGGVFLCGAFTGAPVCKGHIDSAFSVDVQVVEIQQVAV